ncbi:MAG: peptide chain release factor N(5)-glutamine methyltransferase [Pseudomonadota bacterium]
MSQSFGELIRAAAKKLASAGIADASREARLLMAHAAEIPRDRIVLMSDDIAKNSIKMKFEDIVSDRSRRVPLSHITGTRAFYEHDFIVTPDVLDPRPETETLVQEALKLPFQNVLDLGTGSGAILLSLLAARKDVSGIGTDVSPAALDVARQNAQSIGVTDRAMFLYSSWFDSVEGKFDLIVSNPPYIASEEMSELEPELTYEPRIALTDEADGLTCYREITSHASTFLKSSGHLLVEIGYRQSLAVTEMFKSAGFVDVRVVHDIDARDRVIVGKPPT